MKQMSERSKTMNRIVALAIIALFAISIFFLYYAYMPLGDDVLCMSKGAIHHYFDGERYSATALVESVNDVVATVTEEYTIWPARVIPKVLYYASMSLTPFVRAVYATIIFTLLLCFIIGLVVESENDANDTKVNILDRPLLIAVVAVICLWYNGAMLYFRMMIFLNMYVLTTLLYCCYYFFHRRMRKGQYNGIKYVALLQLFGLIVGSLHEVMGLFVIALIGIEIIIDSAKGRYQFKKVFLHSGFLVGYLSCVLAPGNFNRTQSAHQSNMELPFSTKFFQCARTFLSGLFSKSVIGVALVILLILALIVFITLFIRNRSKCMAGIVDAALPIVCTSVIFVVTWSVFGYIPSYAMLFIRVFIWMALLRYIKANSDLFTCRRLPALACAAAVLLAGWFAVRNCTWLAEETSVAMQRRALIQQALEAKQTEVVVPRYPLSAPPSFTMTNYLNNQKEFDIDYYRLYYGIHIILDE